MVPTPPSDVEAHDAAPTRSALIRVTLVSTSRRADLALPGGIPLIEMAPDLARDLGILDPGRAAHGYRFVTAHGRDLDLDQSLVSQGVADGAVLSVEARTGDGQKVYDDVVEAVADLVESEFAPWTPRHSAATALGASTVLFLTAAYALFTARGPLLVTAVAAAATALLLLTAAVLGLSRQQYRAAAVVTGTAAAFAAVTALAAQPHAHPWRDGVLGVGVAIAITALVGTFVSGPHRPVLAGSAIAGLGLALLGGLPALFDLPRVAVAAGLVAVVTIVGNVLPWIAVTTGRLTPHAPMSDAEIFGNVPVVDEDHVRAQVMSGHAVMVAVGLATGIITVAAAPDLVASGVWGTALVLCALGVTVLRTRHTRTRATVLIAMAVTVIGVALTAVVASNVHPGWRPSIALALAGTAAVTIVLALLLPRSRVRLGRLADAIEGLLLVALLPLAAYSMGLI